MINPRRTTLLRVSDLQGFQRAIAASISGVLIEDIQACAVLVPSRAAAGQLRRTLENLLLGAGAQQPVVGACGALALPDMLTRHDLYGALHERLADAPTRLSDVEREVLFRAAAQGAIQGGTAPPFELRPGLIAEILGFFDALMRHRRTLEQFERLVLGELESSVEFDRGANRLVTQTRFLVSTFRSYESRREATGALDEHALRQLLLQTPAPQPLRHLIVTVPDRAADPFGLWDADFDLMARLPGLERIDIVATEALLASGFHERLHILLPEIEEERVGGACEPPVLKSPSDPDGPLYFMSRDREDELMDVVRRLKKSTQPPAGASARGVSDRSAVVFQRPLPYLYLARQLFMSGGVPYQTDDNLPLAVEPYAAALDLVFTCVRAGFTRASMVALLSCPQLRFEHEGIEVMDRSRGPRRALHVGPQAAAAITRALEPLDAEMPPSQHLELVLNFLRRHDRVPAATDPLRERHLRARAAIISGLEQMRDAYGRWDAAPVRAGDLAADIRRWIEAQTFSPRYGAAGVHLIDAHAARFGDFDDVQIVGVVEGEWPEPGGHEIFYPSRLLRGLGWPAEADTLKAGRAAFYDLVHLARRQVSLSSFSLEDESVALPAALLEDVSDFGLKVERTPVGPTARIFAEEALTESPVVPSALDPDAAEWLHLRAARSRPDAPGFHGAAGARARTPYTVTSVETYLQCPFKYFASRVLGVEEEREDEAGLTPLARGRFLHEVFRDFYAAWQALGHATVTPANIDAARDEFRLVAERRLSALTETDRLFERMRLLGSPAAAGIAEWLFRLEAESGAPVVERLLEFPLDGRWTFRGAQGQDTLAIRGNADRIDLLADGTFRLIDYKTGRAPDRRSAVQLPVYAATARQRLSGHAGRSWEPGEAAYVAFGERQPLVPLVRKGEDIEAALLAGETRFLEAVAGIERGEFPPRPAERSFCVVCAYASICRKDYVIDPPSPEASADKGAE